MANTQSTGSARELTLGVDVGGTRIKVALADESGRLLSSKMLETHHCHAADSFLQVVAGEIATQAKACAVTTAAAGIGCPDGSTSTQVESFG